jgi:hypothetical protein
VASRPPDPRLVGVVGPQRHHRSRQDEATQGVVVHPPDETSLLVDVGVQELVKFREDGADPVGVPGWLGPGSQRDPGQLGIVVRQGAAPGAQRVRQEAVPLDGQAAEIYEDDRAARVRVRGVRWPPGDFAGDERSDGGRGEFG